MKRWVKAALLFVMLTAFGLLAWEGSRIRERRRYPPEPVFRGKALQVWLKEYRANSTDGDDRKREQAEAAIREMGTNAIPTLLTMLRQRDSAVKVKLIDLWGRYVVYSFWLPAWLRYAPCFLNTAQFQNHCATDGFGILGSIAQPAVPALIDIYERNISASSQFEAALALTSPGLAASNAIPTFLRATTNRDGAVREAAVLALCCLNLEPRSVVPALARSLTDSNVCVRLWAAEGLGRFGLDAQQAVTSLRPLLSDTNRIVRTTAAYALQRIEAGGTPQGAQGVSTNQPTL